MHTGIKNHVQPLHLRTRASPTPQTHTHAVIYTPTHSFTHPHTPSKHTHSFTHPRTCLLMEASPNRPLTAHAAAAALAAEDPRPDPRGKPWIVHKHTHTDVTHSQPQHAEAGTIFNRRACMCVCVCARGCVCVCVCVCSACVRCTWCGIYEECAWYMPGLIVWVEKWLWICSLGDPSRLFGRDLVRNSRVFGCVLVCGHS